MQGERPFRLTAINPNVFHAGLGRGRQLEQPAQGRGRSESQFLAQFAHGAGVVVLAAVQMTRGRGIPGAGKAVLFHGAFLQKDFAARVEDQNVDGAMLKAEAMDLGACVAADDFIAVVHDIENFFAHGLAIICANLTKVGKSTRSARMVSGSPRLAKAACKRSPGQSCLRSLSIILRRCEKPRLTSLRKTG